MMRANPTMCFSFALAALVPVCAFGATLNVPGDFATIQACVDAAQVGDECVVAPGTYHELIDFLGKAITLRSSGGLDVTIIDAGPVADPGTGKPVVRCDTGEGAGTVLEGFTITGGTGDTTSFFTAGGGMYNVNSSPTVIDCTFSGNAAGFGGGMRNKNSSPAVTNCRFSGNTANKGGGIANSGGDPTMTNCTFNGNTSFEGGGIFNSVSNATVSNCMFTENSASSAGGGMYTGGSNLSVTNCTFSGNSGGLFGGGMYIANSSRVTNCTFSGNTADKGGGMYNFFLSSPRVTNCAFAGNTSTNGGGIYNCTSIPTLTNCVLWGDTPDEVFNDDSATLISFTDIQGSGGSSGWDASLGKDAGGNIDADPWFVDADGADNTVGTEDDNLRLLPGSPCIDAGDPALIPRPTESDLDGHARVLCMRVDMGAYEFGIGDFDCDQIVTLTDFTDWTGCMTAPDAQSISPACEAFDFEFDGDVDLIDWAGFQNAFTGP